MEKARSPLSFNLAHGRLYIYSIYASVEQKDRYFVHIIEVKGHQNCLVTSIFPKYHHLCSAEESKSYRFGTT